MNEFLKFFDELKSRFPLHMEITYSKITDWNIRIYKAGCAADYPDAVHSGDDVILVEVANCDMEYAFAKAYVDLKDWLLEFNGGY